jgi:tungstate transport system substrate-binding protein
VEDEMKAPGWIAIVVLVVAGGIACASNTDQEEPKPKRPVVLATTTSTYDTGLLDHLVPQFEKKTGMTVKTVAVGTGQALELGRRGEADVLLVHAPAKEQAFVEAGHGRNRRPVMHNDFVVVGPSRDPAEIRGSADAAAALKTLGAARATWISRGDRSGTHTKEQELWRTAGVDPDGDWYVETGQGMGATLRIADERRGYTLSDRGTFIATAKLELEVLVEGDPRLFNPYHVIEVIGPNVNTVGAAALAGFFVERETQEAIRDYRLGGRQLFTPDAEK